jgi:hypothetical protein
MLARATPCRSACPDLNGSESAPCRIVDETCAEKCTSVCHPSVVSWATDSDLMLIREVVNPGLSMP